MRQTGQLKVVVVDEDDDEDAADAVDEAVEAVSVDAFTEELGCPMTSCADAEADVAEEEEEVVEVEEEEEEEKEELASPFGLCQRR